jgi:tRNA nucleotidyltransferase/poly(A) polymerase
MLEAGFQIVKTLQSRGHLAYIAGGWVRDALLGRPGVDVDIATSASVMEVSCTMSMRCSHHHRFSNQPLNLTSTRMHCFTHM